MRHSIHKLTVYVPQVIIGNVNLPCGQCPSYLRHQTMALSGLSFCHCLSLFGTLYYTADAVGIVTAVPNIVRKFGWNPAVKVTEFMKQAIKDKTGSQDTTFWEVSIYSWLSVYTYIGLYHTKVSISRFA